MIFNDRLISQLLYAQKVSLELKYVLLVHRDDLYCIQLLRLLILTFINSGIGSFAD